MPDGGGEFAERWLNMTGRWGLSGVLLVCAGMASAQGNASGQVTEVRLGNTKLDAAQFRQRQIVMVDRFPIGSVYGGSGGRVEVEAVVVRTPGSSGGKTKGVTLRVGSQRGSDHLTRVASMDEAEVNEASQALAKIVELSADASVKDRSEISFRTTNDIVMGYSKVPRQAYGFVSIGIGSNTTAPGFTEYLTSNFDADELGTLRMLFDRASDLLAAK
jgi:hypothetical protein